MQRVGVVNTSTSQSFAFGPVMADDPFGRLVYQFADAASQGGQTIRVVMLQSRPQGATDLAAAIAAAPSVIPTVTLGIAAGAEARVFGWLPLDRKSFPPGSFIGVTVGDGGGGAAQGFIGVD